MSGRQSNLTNKEIEDLQNLVTETLTSVYAMADKLATFAKVASVQNYKTSHTNADRIRNMSDEELASVLFSGCVDSMDLEECPYYVSESKLDNNKIRKICKKCTLDWLQLEAE